MEKNDKPKKEPKNDLQLFDEYRAENLAIEKQVDGYIQALYDPKSDTQKLVAAQNKLQDTLVAKTPKIESQLDRIMESMSKEVE